jgi:hypothetical protein
MSWLFSQIKSFSSEHERTLRAITIKDDSPGTILRDFEAMVSFIRSQGMPVTGRHQLPLQLLPQINARLAHPIQLGLKRPRQKSYPHINGLYLLVRASGLTRVEGTPQKPLLIVDEAVYQSWESLNATEQYCALLESWLLRGSPEIIGEDRRPMFFIPETFRHWCELFLRIPETGMAVAGDKDAELTLGYWPGWHNIALLQLFGCITVQEGEPQPGKGWRVESLSRTRFGDALLVLLTDFFGGEEIMQIEVDRKVAPGMLQPTLGRYFPQWKNNLVIPEQSFRDGIFVFKVSLGNIWRRIAIPANQTLDSLASAILNAVKFDHDHLYMFSYQNRFGTLERVYHPEMEEGPWATEVLIGDLPLGIGQMMTYLFDFGDNWEFDVTLERIDPPDRKKKKPLILEEHGRPPEQYPSWDE